MTISKSKSKSNLKKLEESFSHSQNDLSPIKKKWNFESNDYEIESELMSPAVRQKRKELVVTASREVEIDNPYVENEYYLQTNPKIKEDTLEPIQDYNSNSEYESDRIMGKTEVNILS